MQGISGSDGIDHMWPARLRAHLARLTVKLRVLPSPNPLPSTSSVLLEKSFNWHLGCRSHAQRQSVIGRRADGYWFGCGSRRRIDAQQRRVYNRADPSFLACALKSAEARGLVVHPAAE